jgi:hypothetical protein
MEDFQQRVVNEKVQLDEKIGRLRRILNDPIFPTIPRDDQELLEHQFELMKEYSDVLGDRIKRFALSS